MEDRVFDGVENDFDVFRVDGGREMVEKGFFRVLFGGAKILEEEGLDVGQLLFVARELWEVPPDRCFTGLEFFLEEVCFIQEEDYRSSAEVEIVDDGVKYITGLLESVGFSKTKKNHVVRRCIAQPLDYNTSQRC